MELPTIGSHPPRRGNALTRWLGRVGLRLMRFTVEGSLPDVPKFVVIGAPHTSNWDFPLAMSLLFSLGVDVKWIGKHTLFRGPMGWVMRWLGGVPVDRRAKQGLVSQVIEQFNRSERYAIGLSPEGTRRLVTEWRSGFCRIAKGAGVPIVLAILDFGKRTVILETVPAPSGELDTEIANIRSRFRNAVGLKPDQYDPG